ncbi:efflux RND transporter periplasmic adaptor subunit [Chthoniobacter sp.]|uniref:efflux RND transporter periplasmic adaptor subunit n=1 Tax=Chthoniobacter sp. TaxID=2510640 RepID=UPI0032AF70D7
MSVFRVAVPALLITALWSAGCSKHGALAVHEPLASVPVRVVAVEKVTRPANEEVVGNVQAKLHAAIEAKVTGRMESLLVAPGQLLKAGDLIAQLDAREIQARLDQALAVREQATRDLERARDLFAKKINTQAELDGAQARERVAVGAVKETETMLGYTKIVAPFNGVVTRQLADVGDLATPGKPIVEMENPDALRFEADVPEALIGHVKLGAKLPVRISAVPTPIAGTVVEMAPVASPASRTFLVKLDLPPTEGARSGQFGRVLVPTGESQTIRVPAAALISRGQMETVFVAADHHAQLRLVRSGKRLDGEVELLSGISPGESVVIEGADQLHDGQPITLKP